MKDTKEFILQAAYNMFLYSNYETVTFSALSKSTGLTKGAIYHHFSSKEELFKAVVDKYLIESRSDDDFTDMSLSELVEYTVKKVKKDVSNALATHPNTLPLQIITFSIEAYRHYPGYAQKGWASFQKEKNKWKKVLDKSIKNGEIRSNVDTDIMTENFITIGMGIVSNMMLSESVEYALDMFEKQINELYKAIKK